MLADVKASGVTAVNLTVSSVGNGPGKFEETVGGIAFAEQQIADHPDHFMKVLTGSRPHCCEGARPHGSDLRFPGHELRSTDSCIVSSMFHGLGVRIVQPVYNRRNLMGDGCLEPADGGLSTLGRELVAEINKLKILLDLSHAGAAHAEPTASPRPRRRWRSRTPAVARSSTCRATLTIAN